ncbi:MAG: hypothetical protein HPM95_14120 [Alphaproteobacteria bacterium]|nr:hypothetical protein [Alphaproteobacteria bacterium]
MLTDDLTPGMAMIVGGLGLGVPATILMLRAAGWLGRDPAPVLEPLPEPSRHARSVGAVPDYDADDDEDDDHGGGRWQALVGALAHMGCLPARPRAVSSSAGAPPGAATRISISRPMTRTTTGTTRRASAWRTTIRSAGTGGSPRCAASSPTA